MILQTKTDSQLVVTSPQTDQVLIYDLDAKDTSGNLLFDWNRATYPYIISPYDPGPPENNTNLRKVLNLLPSSQPAAVDVGYVQDPQETGPFYSRAFIVNSGTLPGSDPDNPTYYDSFAVIDVDGISSSLVSVEETLGIGAEPEAVEVKSDGTQSYFTCPGTDEVRYANSVDFDWLPIQDSPNHAAVITNAKDISLGEMIGPGAAYFEALSRMVRLLPGAAFDTALEHPRQDLISAIQDVVVGYDDRSNEAIQATIALIITARDVANLVLDVAFYCDAVIERLHQGIRRLNSQMTGKEDPQTTAVMLMTLVNGIPVTSFDTASDKNLAVASISVLPTLLSLNNPAYVQALERLETLEGIIRDTLNDVGLSRLILAAIEECRSTILHIQMLFDQAVSVSESLTSTVSGLPDSSFRNHGGQVSLLAHIGILKNLLEDDRLSNSMTKADQVKSDIQTKVTDQTAQSELIGMIDEIHEILQSVGNESVI